VIAVEKAVNGREVPPQLAKWRRNRATAFGRYGCVL
jgi:hypothetical protein